MTSALSLAMELASEIKEFPLHKCGPSDDPDKQYAYTSEFRDSAKRFVGALKRIGDPDLSSMVSELDTSPSFISEAHDLKAELMVVIDYLMEAASDLDYGTIVAINSKFLDAEVIERMKLTTNFPFDLRKLIKMCEELNDAYSRGNYISSTLLLRAIMNHVPPIFGAQTFSEVVAQSGRSAKSILSRLNDEARPIADLHTHYLIRKSEHLPSKNQIEPYKAGFEVLMQEVLSRGNNPDA